MVSGRRLDLDTEHEIKQICFFLLYLFLFVPFSWGMANKLSNEEFMQRLMTQGCPTGALIQAFIISALDNYSKKCIEAGPKPFDSGFLNGEAWIETAKHVQAELVKNYD